MIGFQEIVKLTPKQIMATDEGKRRVWEHEIERTINRRGTRYAQLRSGQLVGAALMIYAKESSLPHIRNVECAIKKVSLLCTINLLHMILVYPDCHYLGESNC